MKLNTDLALNFTQAWLNEHIIGHWKFDEESIGDVADASGHELHGRVKLATVVLGKFGRALHQTLWFILGTHIWDTDIWRVCIWMAYFQAFKVRYCNYTLNSSKKYR